MMLLTSCTLVVAAGVCVCLGSPQVIRVVDISRPSNPNTDLRRNQNYPRTINVSEFANISLLKQDGGSSESPVFGFLRPTGLRISVPGPYPPSNQYRLKFHININKEFDGWKRGDWNEGVIVRYGMLWSYTFPQIQVKQGDIIYYWIEAEGSDWEKGYKGKYEVSQPAPHGIASGSSAPCRRGSLTTYSGGSKACAAERLISSYTQVAPKYMRRGSQYFMESVKQIGEVDAESTFTIFSKDNILWNSTHNAFILSLLEDKYGASAINSANFTVKGCTSKIPDQCTYGAVGYLIVPPILSGRHSTQNSFSFRYGTLEVTARLPKGDWIVPELWLMPKDQTYGNSSGRIILATSRGNPELSDGNEDYSSRVLEAGVETSSGKQMFRKVQSKPWPSDYHKFKLIWTPDIMEFLVDGEEIGRIQPAVDGLDPSLQGNKIAPFDQEFYLVFGVHVGGDKDFPDSLIGKPWKNHEPKNKLKFWKARDTWQQTWSVDSALIIKGLTITALDH